MATRPIFDPGDADGPLPAGQLDGRPAAASAVEALTDRPLVLVADDDPAIRSLLKRALEREGFEVVLAADGREALEGIRLREIAVLLLDVNMPGMGGLEVLRQVRSEDRTRTLPIILVTGTAAEADLVRGLENGANDYLAKPFALKELAARVRAQIRGRAAWTSELHRARENRRRLTIAVEDLPRNVPLLSLAASVAERLPPVIGVDGFAILHFAHGSVRAISASGSLRSTFIDGRLMSRQTGREVAHRAEAGAWLDAAGRVEPGSEPMDVAYVPFRLGPTAKPLGCLVYATRPGAVSGPLSHRLPDLIDATEFIVAILRPAVEAAETADAAITRLRRIIARREYAIHLQPVVRLETGEVVAVEALTRFADGTPPDVVFAEAASLGLSLALQRATLSAAIEAAASLSPEVALSVNLSADVLQHEPLLPHIAAGAGRPLIVEITEHERIDDYGAVRKALVALGPNVRLAVDDAGSGYASLRHILALQPAFVKLDIEWVHQIDRDPVRRALVSGLAYFASETGCELIAEGIETADELAAIRGLGIKLGQGYLLGRPEAAADERGDN